MFLEYLKKCLVIFVIGYSVAYFSPLLGAGLNAYWQIFEPVIRQHMSLIQIVAISCLLLATPSTYNYLLNYNKHVEKNSAIFSHEMDSIYLCTISAVLCFLYIYRPLDPNSDLYIEWLAGIPLTLISYSLIGYILYRGFPTNLRLSLRFLISTIAFIILLLSTYSIIQSHQLYGVGTIFVLYSLAFASAAYSMPWVLINTVLVYLTYMGLYFSGFATQFGIGLSKQDQYKNNIWRLIPGLARGAILNAIIYVLIWPFRHAKRNQGSSKEPTSTKFSKVLSLFEGKRGQNPEDKAYRNLTGLMRYARKIPYPPLQSDTETSVVDLLDRKQYIDNLKKIISTYLNGVEREPITIGLFGEWGDGKTFVINRLIQEIRAAEEDIICCVIQPWKIFLAGSEKDVIENFFLVIEHDISTEIRSARLNRLLREYAKLLSGQVNLSHGIWSLNIAPTANKSFEEIQAAIKKELAKANKKLLIILEDMDRLSKDELITCFRLLRAGQGFSNTIYLLPCDKRQIDKIVQEAKLDPSYSQKFIQLELYLPPIDTDTLKNFIMDELKEYWCDVLSMDEDHIHEAVESVTGNPEFFAVIKNLRHCKRLVNGLKMPYVQIHGNVCLADYIELELLKQNFPVIYSDMQDNYKYYVPSLDFSFRMLEAGALKAEAKAHIDAVFNKNNYPKHMSNAAWEILNRLFPHFDMDTEDMSKKMRLSNPRYFLRYFSGKISPAHVSNIRLNAVVSACLEAPDSEAKRILLSDIEELIAQGTYRDFFSQIFGELKDDIPSRFYEILFDLLIEAPHLLDKEEPIGDDAQIRYLVRCLRSIDAEKISAHILGAIEELSLLKSLIFINAIENSQYLALDTILYREKLTAAFINTIIMMNLNFFEAFPSEDLGFVFWIITKWNPENEEIAQYFIETIRNKTDQQKKFIELFRRSPAYNRGQTPTYLYIEHLKSSKLESFLQELRKIDSSLDKLFLEYKIIF